MSYEDLLGSLVRNPMNTGTIEHVESDEKGRIYPKVRGMLNTAFIVHSEHEEDIEKCCDTFFRYGYDRLPSTTQKFQKALVTFRTYLDFYDAIIKEKVFSRDEIYIRSLREGPAFTKYIKKCRQASLQAKIALDDIYIDEQYIIDEYSGYDSIIHERYLMPWDETNETQDWHYSLIESSEIKDITIPLGEYLKDIDLSKFKPKVSTFEPYKGSKSTNNANDKIKHYLRDTWTEDMTGPYMADRRVLMTSPGTVRDTGVPDPFTLHKIRIANQYARYVAENTKNSANVPIAMLEKRIATLTKCKAFIHLDFKKYGLTFERDLYNKLMHRFGRDDLAMNEFILRTEEGPIRTNRGGVLGWFDPCIAICVSAIIHSVLQRYKVNSFHLVFNDDVEIGIAGKGAEDYAIQLKDIIINELEQYGFIMSYRKCFVSREMIFLEQYYKFEFDEEPLDMRKLQLTVNSFAKSALDEIPWRAKILFADGAGYVNSTYARERCISTIEPEFDPREVNWDIRFGGWERFSDEEAFARLDNWGMYNWALAQSSFKSPLLTDRSDEADMTSILRNKMREYYNSLSASIINFQSTIELDEKPPDYNLKIIRNMEALPLRDDEPIEPGARAVPEQSEGSFG